jgi:homoserine O-acetyltransferase
VRDLVRLQGELVAALGVERIRLVVGGSLGGMQALEWALLFPERVESVAALATNARHSPWQVAWSEAQRLAIAADPRWRGGAYPVDDPPRAGLAAARAMAMVSYRAPGGFEERFARRREADGTFAVAGWLARHGERLVDRFDAASYVTLTRTMDTHDLARGRGELAAVLGTVRLPVLVGTIPSDVLYPPAEQRELAARLGRGELATIDSPHGHDGFLIESAQVEAALRDFRERTGTARTIRSRRRRAAGGGR